MKKLLLTLISGMMIFAMCAGVYAAPETQIDQTDQTVKEETAGTKNETETETEEERPQYYFDIQLVEPYAKENVKYFGNSLVSVNDNGKYSELKVTKDVKWDGRLDKKSCFKKGEKYTAVITFEADANKILGSDTINLDDFGVTLPDRFEIVNLEKKENNLYEVTVSVVVRTMPVSKDKKHKHDKPLPENKIGKKAAGCETEGYQIYDCRCGYREIKDLAVLGHDMKDNGSIAASCEKDGAKKEKCSRCDKTTETKIAALGHDMKDNGSFAATCEKDGAKKEKCSRCDKTTETKIAATGHNWKYQSTDQATCENNGADHYRCANCNQTKDETISALGHNWEFTYKDNPGCEYAGADHYICSRCKQTWDDSLSAVGHDWVAVADSPALCETNGQHIYECSRCGASYTEEIPATGHNWYRAGGGAPDCTNEGSKWYLCSNPGCTADYTEYLPAMGHDMILNYDNGGHWSECVRCGHTDIYESHVYSEVYYGDHYEYYCWCGYGYTVWD